MFSKSAERSEAKTYVGEAMTQDEHAVHVSAFVDVVYGQVGSWGLSKIYVTGLKHSLKPWLTQVYPVDECLLMCKRLRVERVHGWSVTRKRIHLCDIQTFAPRGERPGDQDKKDAYLIPIP